GSGRACLVLMRSRAFRGKPACRGFRRSVCRGGYGAVSVLDRLPLLIATWDMPRRFTFGRDARVNVLLGAGHFLSHFYQLCLPPLFIAWQQGFDVSFAELGLAMAVMSATAAVRLT